MYDMQGDGNSGPFWEIVGLYNTLSLSCSVDLRYKQRSQLQLLSWVMQGDGNSGPFWEIYSLYNIHDLKFEGIYWDVMPRQIPTALALFFVVAFGSSLAVAAFQQDPPDSLNHNAELVTVGQLFMTLG